MIHPNQLHELMIKNTKKSYAQLRFILLANMDKYYYTQNDWNDGNIIHGLIMNAKYVTLSTLHDWINTLEFAVSLGADPILKNKYYDTALDVLEELFGIFPSSEYYKAVKDALSTKGITFENVLSKYQSRSIHRV